MCFIDVQYCLILKNVVIMAMKRTVAGDDAFREIIGW